MITIAIPSLIPMSIHDLILDFNGTLAIDGKVIPGVRERIITLAADVNIHVVTGNSFGTAEEELKGLPCKVVLLAPDNQAKEKLDYLQCLNTLSTISIGNGRNDKLLLKSSVISIVVVQAEGASVEAIKYAHVVCTSIISALDMIISPARLVATLRS